MRSKRPLPWEIHTLWRFFALFSVTLKRIHSNFRTIFPATFRAIRSILTFQSVLSSFRFNIALLVYYSLASEWMYCCRAHKGLLHAAHIHNGLNIHGTAIYEYPRKLQTTYPSINRCEVRERSKIVWHE